MKLIFKYNILLKIIIVMYVSTFSAIFANNTYKPGVNKFAWYAALQTINFMPILGADPFGGVIFTDWYSVGNNEKYKIDVYINEGLLTANTITVKVFKQKRIAGAWIEENPNLEMASKIENTILTTARQLRIENSLTTK